MSPGNFLPRAERFRATSFSLAVLLGVVLGGWASPVPPGPGQRVDSALVAEFWSGERIPHLFFREVEGFALACYGNSQVPGKRAAPVPPPICRELSPLGNAVGLDSGQQKARILELRLQLIESFGREFRIPAAFEDPLLLKKVRLLAYLDTGELLGELAYYGDSADLARCNVLKERLTKLRKERDGFPGAGVGPHRNSDAIGKGLQILIPDLPALLALADYVKEAIRVPPDFWPRLWPAFHEYEITRLRKGGGPGGPLENRMLKRRSPFANKLEVLLRDALWAASSTASRELGLSSYLLGPTQLLSRPDSILIAQRVIDFGSRHSHLAFRIDRKNPATWKDARQVKLAVAIEQETVKIIRGLSGTLFQWLDTLPEVEVRILIRGADYPDLFRVQYYHSVFKRLFRNGTDSWKLGRHLTSVFPFLPEEVQSAVGGQKLFEKALDGFAKAMTQAQYTALMLAMKDFISLEFHGNSGQLRSAVEFKRLL